MSFKKLSTGDFVCAMFFPVIVVVLFGIQYEAWNTIKDVGVTKNTFERFECPSSATVAFTVSRQKCWKNKVIRDCSYLFRHESEDAITVSCLAQNGDEVPFVSIPAEISEGVNTFCSLLLIAGAVADIVMVCCAFSFCCYVCSSDDCEEKKKEEEKKPEEKKTVTV